MKKQQFILLNHMQRITVKCMKYYNRVYFIVSTGCGTADEHTERSAVAEWDAALQRSAYPYVHQLCRILAVAAAIKKYNFLLAGQHLGHIAIC